jgi:hypothetical protein
MAAPNSTIRDAFIDIELASRIVDECILFNHIPDSFTEIVALLRLLSKDGYVRMTSGSARLLRLRCEVELRIPYLKRRIHTEIYLRYAHLAACKIAQLFNTVHVTRQEEKLKRMEEVVGAHVQVSRRHYWSLPSTIDDLVARVSVIASE